MHLLIPYAHSNAPECQPILAQLRLPNLQRLLREFHLRYVDENAADTFSPPHERAHARALTGIDKPPREDDAHFPWATWYMLQHHPLADRTGSWAFITPCHWQVQTSDVVMLSPGALGLTNEESLALMQSMQPYFAGDGVRLVFDKASTWLASGDIFRGLKTASLDRVVGQSVKAWMPSSDKAKPLRRLQTEMQMLLHTHPINRAREATGKLPVNSFWVSGTGRESALVSAPLHADKSSTFDHQSQTQYVAPSEVERWHEANPNRPDIPKGRDAFTVHIPQALREAARARNWTAWGHAWETIDRTYCARLLTDAQNSGPPRPAQPLPQLTLCGELNALTFQARFRTPMARLKRRVLPLRSGPAVHTVLQHL